MYEKEMFPNDARIRNLTYKSSIFCNIGVHFIFQGKLWFSYTTKSFEF